MVRKTFMISILFKIQIYTTRVIFKEEENIKAVDSNEHESEPSYLNDSLEGFHDGDDEEEEEEIHNFSKSNLTEHNNSSCLNVSVRPERSDINNSVNNTITAVTLLNNNLNNQNGSSAEITSSLTSFSSLSSSEATNSNSNGHTENNKDLVLSNSSTTSPSSTSSSPCKFLLDPSSNKTLKQNSRQNITIDCKTDFDHNSSNLSTSSPKYLSSPSSLESTPTSRTTNNNKDHELDKEINELDNSTVPIELNTSKNYNKETDTKRSKKKRSAIPVHNNQRILHELNSKYSSQPRNLFDSKPSTANTSLVEEAQFEPISSQLSRPSLPGQTISHQTKDLHNQVCSIANKCTCEKQFLVDKIGEGKYKIGNTKNILFIRVNLKTYF